MSFREIPGFHHPGAVQRMKYKRLGNTDMHISKVGLGGAPLSLVLYGSVKESDAIELVHEALKSGINYVDTSYWYGQGASETVIGKALKGVPRESFYISSKIGRYEKDEEHQFDYSYERTVRAVDDALQRLQLDYVDLMFVHDIEFVWLTGDRPLIWEGALRALSEAKAAGKIKNIGVSGYGLEPLADVIKRSSVPIDAIITYCQATLYSCDLQSYVTQLRRYDGTTVGIINASPTGMGLLSPGGPQPWHPGPEHLKVASRKVVEHCASRGVEVAKLAIHYAAHFPGVDGALLGLTNVSMLPSSLSAVCEPLSDLEKQVIEEAITMFGDRTKNHWRYVDPDAYKAKLGFR